MVGKEIHGSTIMAIIDFLFAPLAWGIWLFCHEVNISIIRAAFSFFLQ
jgi:hypothetical protein